MTRDKTLLGMILVLFFFWAAPRALADEEYEQFLPEFQAYAQDHKVGNLDGLSNTSPKIPATIRILIFPHLGPYGIPQGRETIFDEVTFRSTENCTIYPENSTKLKQPPRSARTITIRYADIATEGLFLQCPTRTTLVREKGLRSYDYQGTFFVKGALQNGKPTVQVVQHVPFETYLKGVIPAEMPASWSMEALKAQAIAARSYALFQYQQESAHPKARHYDLDDTVYYQAYLGLSWMHDNTNKAVDETIGQVLWHKERPAKAYFSADSGGYTEIAENVWNGSCGFCVSRPEVYDLNLGPRAWTITRSLAAIEASLRAANWHKGPAHLQALRIDRKGVNQSGRVMEVETFFSDGRIVRIFGPSFQQALHMRSNLFTVKNSTGVNGENQLEFEGRGFGHGVGMNQWGARILARNYGWNFRQILFFYYSSVDIR